MESKKRKREDDRPLPVVTFLAPQNRTFDRVLRDQSFSDVKALVKKKLELDGSAKIRLVQLRDGREIDLDDEEDYEAFRALSRSLPSLQVLVRVGDIASRPQHAPAAQVQTEPVNTMRDRPLLAPPQPVAGPSSMTLDAITREEEDVSPPRKKKKSDKDRSIQPAPDVADSSAADKAKKRKKKHKAREPSSGSAADLSSNLPEAQGNLADNAPKKRTGPFVVDSTEPSRAASPHIPLSSQVAGKSQGKRKNTEDAPAVPAAATPTAEPREPTRKKKRSEEQAEEVEEPQPKKAKKKAKDVSAASVPTVTQVPAAVPDAPAAKAKKASKKKGQEPDIGQDALKSANSITAPTAPAITPSVGPPPVIPPTSEKAPRKGKKAELANERTQQTADQGKSKKKATQTQAASDNAVADNAAAQDTPSHEPVKRKRGKAASKSEVDGPAETTAEPKNGKKLAKVKAFRSTVSAADIEEDILAAVTAVLSKNGTKSSPATPLSQSVAGTSTANSGPASASVSASQKSGVNNTPSASHAKPGKSKLNKSWGPADITEESATSDPSNPPQAAVEPESISAVITAPKKKRITASTPSTAPNGTTASAASKPAPAARQPSPEPPTPALSAALPAGSTISEVTVQGQDEGSSSDGDDSEDERVAASPPKLSARPSLSRVAASASNSNSVDLSEVDVEALLRGPVTSRSVLSLLPSESDSDEEKEESESEPLASEQEEMEEKAYRRMSKRFEREAPSSDEEPMDDVEPAAPEEKASSVPAISTAAETPEAVAVGSSPVESPAPVAVEKANTSRLDAPVSPSEVKSADEDAAPQEDPDEGNESDEVDAEMTAPSPPPAAAEEAEEIIPTSDPAEAAEAEAVQPSTLEDIPSPARASSPVPSVQPASANPAGHEAPEEEENESDEDEDDESAVPAVITHPAFSKLDDALLMQHSQEDPADPIEPSEDLAFSSDIAMEDPIEFDPLADSEEQGRITPPASTPKPGTAKRMKDRNGKVPTSDTLPALASQRSRTRATRSTSRTVAPEQDATQLVDPSQSSEAPEPTPTPAPRRSARRSPPESSSQPAPAPEPAPTPAEAPAPKRRGRPAQSAEEKAQKAAEREAEKKRKAEEREAERKRKAAEKEAEKQRKAAEKAEKAAAAKAKKGAGKKAAPSPEESADADMPEAPAQLTSPPSQPVATPSKADHSQDAAHTTAKWTVLSQATSGVDGADADTSMSMVDELRSSSPEAALNDTVSSRLPAQTDDHEQDNDPGSISQQLIDVPESDDETPTVKAATTRPGAKPLFVPSESQYPAPGSSPQRGEGSQSQSQSQSQPQSSQTAKFKRPSMGPISSWANQSKFRRLSDLASQDMFSPVTSHAIHSRRQSTVEDRQTSLYGDLEDDDSDDDSDDSEGENISHIPKNRRAGVHKKEMFVE